MHELAACLAREAEKYFHDPEHRKQFEAWYLERYGKPYDWRHPKDRRERKGLTV